VGREQLEEIIKKADKAVCNQYCPHSSKPKAIAKLLAQKTLILHKDLGAEIRKVQTVENIPFKDAEKMFLSMHPELETPRSIQFGIDLQIDPYATRQTDECIANITRAILAHFPQALEEYEYLDQNNIDIHEYIKSELWAEKR
jgi:hypothetical protein